MQCVKRARGCGDERKKGERQRQREREREKERERENRHSASKYSKVAAYLVIKQALIIEIGQGCKFGYNENVRTYTVRTFSRDKCCFLCYHMYKCSCYDFSNGHLCKHVHRVHSLNLMAYCVSTKKVANKSSNGNLLTTEPIPAVDSELGEHYIPGVTIPTKDECPSHSTGVFPT